MIYIVMVKMPYCSFTPHSVWSTREGAIAMADLFAQVCGETRIIELDIDRADGAWIAHIHAGRRFYRVLFDNEDGVVLVGDDSRHALYTPAGAEWMQRGDRRDALLCIRVWATGEQEATERAQAIVSSCTPLRWGDHAETYRLNEATGAM